jgi:ribonucleoside-diphosphate reductase alpha chain
MKIEEVLEHGNAYDIPMKKVTAQIGTVYHQEGVEVPESWSQLAANIVASKYFYGSGEGRENSVRQLVWRVVDTIASWVSGDSREEFASELSHICLNQYAAFNSPVWFNVGLYQQYKATKKPCNWVWDGEAVVCQNPYEFPMVSACYIQSVEDNMDSIMELAASSARLFKFGSGTGSDMSNVRSKIETITGGGKPSGPLSFIRIYDEVAGVVKSGGVTRRAAMLFSLRADHPDIVEFIESKGREEELAQILIANGVSAEHAYESIPFQNANFSVRVTHRFMEQVVEDGNWQTHRVTGGLGPNYKARAMFRNMAHQAWKSGDPGLQFDSEINNKNTCPGSGRIEASNPCGEYNFLNDTACNLASINLLKFLVGGVFDCDKFRHVVRVMITAMDALIDNANYPTKLICENSHRYRPLGLGYSNLGALLMVMGVPYDSDKGREICGSITSLMQAEAALTSAILASEKGKFEAYEPGTYTGLLRLQRAASNSLPRNGISEAADLAWDDALEAANLWGMRNAQLTVLAPCGTISFMMDCATTGIEPELALVKTKTLAGGGTLELVNPEVARALRNLGFAGDVMPKLDPEQARIFQTSLGANPISWQGHLGMMAAAQPFLSGAISKTINLPSGATVEDVEAVYMAAWKAGLKSVTIYRDGSKGQQPLNIKKVEKKRETRERLPATRDAITHKFVIGGHAGYFTVGQFPDGRPGELFISVSKEGSTLGGALDALGIATSIALQYGVPLEELCDKFEQTRFEPMGFTENPDIRVCHSIIDYIFRFMRIRYLDGKKVEEVKGVKSLDSAPCHVCGGLTNLVGSCQLCPTCGTSGGCS